MSTVEKIQNAMNEFVVEMKAKHPSLSIDDTWWEEPFCRTILSSGPRKGKHCRTKGSFMCTTHSKRPVKPTKVSDEKVEMAPVINFRRRGTTDYYTYKDYIAKTEDRCVFGKLVNGFVESLTKEDEQIIDRLRMNKRPQTEEERTLFLAKKEKGETL